MPAMFAETANGEGRGTLATMDRTLPDRVRQLVDEMEREGGEDGYDSEHPDALTSGDGSEPVEAAVRQILVEMGEDPDREGLAATPSRVRRMYRELTAGYWVDPERLVNNAIFDVDYSQMVLVKDIAFYSLCEHHLLPFFGQASVAYIPEGRVIGLSKIPRIVEVHMRRLQSQEHLAHDVAETIDKILEPRGIAVWMGGVHMCMVMRGVEQESSFMETNVLRGDFLRDERTRQEFMSIVNRRGQHG